MAHSNNGGEKTEFRKFEMADGQHPLFLRLSTDPVVFNAEICESFVGKEHTSMARCLAQAAPVASGFDPIFLKRGLTEADCNLILRSLYRIAHRPEDAAPQDSLSLSDGLQHAPAPSKPDLSYTRIPHISTFEARVRYAPMLQALGDTEYIQHARENRERVAALQAREARIREEMNRREQEKCGK